MGSDSVLRTPDVADLGEVVGALRDWQREAGPMQLHPGDIGWHWRFGAEATALALRTWRRHGRILALAEVDPDGVRLAIAPEAVDDASLAGAVLRDIEDPERGVLLRPTGGLEARWTGALPTRLRRDGWLPGEAWAPHVRELGSTVEAPALRVEGVGPDQASARCAVQRAAFEGSTFTDDKWHVMAAGLPYADARCLLAYDRGDLPVAAATVWSAGRGKPGLIEPLGVHRSHRGCGYGTAIALAAAAALQAMGASSATVCTPSTNLAAVATYRAAGFRPMPEVRDWQRPARSTH